MRFPGICGWAFYCVLAILFLALGASALAADQPTPTLRAGMIGLDTSHATAFTKLLNDPKAGAEIAGCRVVAAFPQVSPDIKSSYTRIEGFTKDMKEKYNVEIVDSIEALLERVDVVLIESVDGRPHLAQALPVLRARKPVFIDKPLAGSLVDAIVIAELSKHFNTPVFSSSSLRWTENAQAVRAGEIGKVMGADTFGPCSLEPTHPDLYWYGVHGSEMLYTVMGTGCKSVVRVHTDDTDFVVGTWKDGRVGTFRGSRGYKSGYGGTAFGVKETHPTGPHEGYQPLVVEIVKFFRTGVPPVPIEETLELFTFMEAADESKRRGGGAVELEDVFAKANAEARKKIADILAKRSNRSSP